VVLNLLLWSLVNKKHSFIQIKCSFFFRGNIGESGLGKATLINSLFLTDLYPKRNVLTAQGNQKEKIHQSIKIEASTVEIEERGVKVRLTIVDTLGYGDNINGTNNYKSILNYIDNQFECYLHDENGLNRRNISDNRIHCLLYFISPFTRGLVFFVR
jgi:septin 2